MRHEKVTDPDKIRRVMDDYFDLFKNGSDKFIISVFTSDFGPSGHIFEGVKVIARDTSLDGEVSYTVANCDSGYSLGLAALRLSRIREVLVFIPNRRVK